MKNNDVRNFVTIREDDDPQRAYLLEVFCGNHYDVISYGDEYHDNIRAKIEGFLEGLDFAGVNFAHRLFTAEYLGNDGGNLKLYKKDIDADFEDVEYYIEDTEIDIELTEVK